MESSAHRRILWPTLGGMALGFFVIQPLIVLVYNLAPKTRLAFHDLSFWKRLLEMSLDPTSIFMGLAFSLLAGGTGFWFGSWLYQRDRLMAEQIESARRLAALDTLQALMVTVAHYIRNANLVIGGFSDQLRRHAADPKEKEHLELVHQASREIDAVIDSLQSLTQISTTQYIVGGTARMIDLKKELDQRLAASPHPGRRQEGPDRAWGRGLFSPAPHLFFLRILLRVQPVGPCKREGRQPQGYSRPRPYGLKRLPASVD